MEEKKLVIEMNFNQPKFTFEGFWTGKDIQTVSNLLRREYLRHQQSIRREAMQPIQAN